MWKLSAQVGVVVAGSLPEVDLEEIQEQTDPQYKDTARKERDRDSWDMERRPSPVVGGPSGTAMISRVVSRVIT